jgi:glycosyltransferase involved in cell wall biosynthesis
MYHPDHSSGANRLAYEEAAYFAANGQDVWMLTQDIYASAPEYQLDSGIHVMRYRVPGLVAFDPRRLSAHQAALSVLLSRRLPEVGSIHGHSHLAYLGACSQYPAARKVFSIHSPITMEMKLNWSGSWSDLVRRGLGLPLLKRIERRCIEQSDVVSVFSAYTAEMLKRIHGGDVAQKIEVVHGWTNVGSFAPRHDKVAARQQLYWPEDVPIFFTLRRLVGRMGLDILLRAVARLWKTGYRFRLMIGGDGPLRPWLEQLAITLQLNECVRFLGRVEEDVLALMYSACDAFVLPSSALECFGLITLEALVAGRPVLATPVGAIPEMLSRIEPKWLARSSQENDLAALLRDFLDSNLPCHSPAELRRFVEADYGCERLLPRVRQLLFPGRGI